MRKMIYVLTLVGALLLTGCADAGKNQKVEAGDSVTLDGSASQGRYGFTIEKYVWKQVRGEAVEIVNAKSSVATFVAPNSAHKKRRKLVFELTTFEKTYCGLGVSYHLKEPFKT